MNDFQNEFGWDYHSHYGNNSRGSNFRGNLRNKRYGDAYGNYRGGYGPPGGFRNPPGPPLGFGPSPGPRPFFIQGRGFGPGGPQIKRFQEDKASRYLIRCGLQKEAVKHLPRTFLRLIEPEYCGVCGQDLNSFSMSRMHYISKNHLKNQKKWLSQHNIIGNNEIPLRSRELYCELCDVQITSKIHAQSHYSGKPHLAIVEGRKKPKNTILLQEGMERRLQQLIRREKKFLKIKAGSTPAEPGLKEAKSVPSELYCDICKTSVTCTEQMAMHLNGKRHLTKEKQHILQMMKGDGAKNDETVNEDTKDNEEANEDENVDEVVADKEADIVPVGEEADSPTDEEKAIEDDWDNGTEAWEDDITMTL